MTFSPAKGAGVVLIHLMVFHRLSESSLRGEGEVWCPPPRFSCLLLVLREVGGAQGGDGSALHLGAVGLLLADRAAGGVVGGNSLRDEEDEEDQGRAHKERINDLHHLGRAGRSSRSSVGPALILFP